MANIINYMAKLAVGKNLTFIRIDINGLKWIERYVRFDDNINEFNSTMSEYCRRSRTCTPWQ